MKNREELLKVVGYKYDFAQNFISGNKIRFAKCIGKYDYDRSIKNNIIAEHSNLKRKLLIMKLLYHHKVMEFSHLYILLKGIINNKAQLKRDLLSLHKHKLIAKRVVERIINLEEEESSISLTVFKLNDSAYSMIEKSYENFKATELINILSFNEIFCKLYSSSSNIENVSVFKKIENVVFTGEIIIKQRTKKINLLFLNIRDSELNMNDFRKNINKLTPFCVEDGKWNKHYLSRPFIVIHGENDNHTIRISKMIRELNSDIERTLNIIYTNDIAVRCLPINLIFNDFSEIYNIMSINASFFK